MHIRSRIVSLAVATVTGSALLAGLHAAAQTKTSKEQVPAPLAAAAPIPTERDVAATQDELIKLLRLSPTLTTVVARDPTLLANQEYVARNNPQLAAFLAAHSEVGRNPDYYLFSHLRRDGGGPDEALERAVWPDVYRSQPDNNGVREFMSDLPPVLALLAFLAAAAWVLRLVIENRRWNRIFKMQSDVHGRLIDKFGSSQELAAYMQTEAGRRFLEAAPIPVNFSPEQRVPNAVARVLTPVQIGVVLVLLGIGLLSLRNAGTDMRTPMLVLGTVILMPGIGFIISAGITWLLATRMGLMPSPHDGPAANTYDAPFGSTGRQ